MVIMIMIMLLFVAVITIVLTVDVLYFIVSDGHPCTVPSSHPTATIGLSLSDHN